MKKFFYLSLFALICVNGSTILAAKKPKIDEGYKIKVVADHKDGLYKSGEKINFSISFSKGDKAVAGKKLSYTISRGGNSNIKGILTSENNPLIVTTSLDRPGFVLCYVLFKTESGKYIRAWGGAGVEVLKITAPKVDKKEIFAFWDAKIKMLNALPLKVTKTPVEVPKRYKNKLECFDLRVNCPGGAPVSGYFIKPVMAKAKSLPAYVSFHGAGWCSANKPYFIAARNVLALDINAHGVDNGKPKDFYTKLKNGRLKGYYHSNADNKEKNYFCGMFMRVYRALQFIKSQPEWDGKTLIVYGSSQGGAQTLFAAAVDPDITLAVSRVPAMCNHYGILEKTGMFYVSERWLGGTLTNRVTINKSIAKMYDIDKLLESDESHGLKKKELASYTRKVTKLHRNLDGVARMKKLPAVMIVVDVNKDDIAVREAVKLKIPVVGICDTNSNPELVAYPIAANDDAVKSIKVITDVLVSAILVAKEIHQKKVAEEKAAKEAEKAAQEAEKAEKEAAQKAERAEKAKKEKKGAPKKDAPKAAPKKEAPKAAPKKEAPKAAPKKEAPKTEAKKEAPKTEAKKEAPKAAPKKEAPKAAPKKEAPKAAPKKEAPKAEAKKAAPKKAAPKKEAPKKLKLKKKKKNKPSLVHYYPVICTGY